MNRIGTQIKRLLFDPATRFGYLARLGLLNHMKDEKYLKKRFNYVFGYKLDLNNPQTFNEKLQWLKLYDRKPDYIKMVDKYEVKDYISQMIGQEYIVPTIGVWERFDDIKFDELPNQFVLKCTHDSGGLVICKDKNNFDLIGARKKIEKSLKYNYFFMGREWPYKDVKPRIIAEKYMENDGNDEAQGELTDYKFMCFNGEVKCSFTCHNRYQEGGLKVTFYDRDWNVMPFERHYPRSIEGLPKPSNYEKMIKLAEKLSKGIPFVRIDFYESGGKIYFGEITFYPGSGFEEFTPTTWDYKLGSWIDLEKK